MKKIIIEETIHDYSNNCDIPVKAIVNKQKKKENKLICEKHNRLLIGKKKCVDCNKQKKKEIPQIILDDLFLLKTYRIVKSCIISSNRMNDINGIEALAADITNDLLEYENKNI